MSQQLYEEQRLLLVEKLKNIKQTDILSLSLRQQRINERNEEIKEYEKKTYHPPQYDISYLNPLNRTTPEFCPKKKSLSCTMIHSPVKNRQYAIQSTPVNKMNKSQSMTSLFPSQLRKSKKKKLSKINYSYTKKIPSYGKVNLVQKQMEAIVYKTSQLFLNKVKSIKTKKDYFNLEKYQKNLLDAADKSFSQKAINDLNSTFKTMRKTLSVPKEKCRKFVRQIENEEKSLYEQVNRANLLYNQIFSDLNYESPNILKEQVKFSSVLKLKKKAVKYDSKT